MEKHFDETYYKEMRKSIKKYSQDYNNVVEKNRILEQAEQQRDAVAERNYKVLQRFGAM